MSTIPALLGSYDSERLSDRRNSHHYDRHPSPDARVWWPRAYHEHGLSVDKVGAQITETSLRSFGVFKGAYHTLVLMQGRGALSSYYSLYILQIVVVPLQEVMLQTSLRASSYRSCLTEKGEKR